MNRLTALAAAIPVALVAQLAAKLDNALDELDDTDLAEPVPCGRPSLPQPASHA